MNLTVFLFLGFHPGERKLKPLLSLMLSQQAKIIGSVSQLLRCHGQPNEML
jgi:hypothetical protein